MFTKNMIQYCKTGDAGVCPNCGKKLIVDIIETPIRNNYNVTCKNCNKSSLFSGVTKKNGDIL